MSEGLGPRDFAFDGFCPFNWSPRESQFGGNLKDQKTGTGFLHPEQQMCAEEVAQESSAVSPVFPDGNLQPFSP